MDQENEDYVQVSIGTQEDAWGVAFVLEPLRS